MEAACSQVALIICFDHSGPEEFDVLMICSTRIALTIIKNGSKDLVRTTFMLNSFLSSTLLCV